MTLKAAMERKKVVGLYETYKKYKKIGGPKTYQSREKWTSVSLPKKSLRFEVFFLQIIEFFRGQTWTIRKLKHLSQIFGCV